MAKSTITLDEDVAEILRASTIDGFNLYLPAQLPREQYMRVDKVLRLAGACWMRKEKAHVVTPETAEKLGMALENGHIVDVKKLHQQFFTPVSEARDIVDNALGELQEPLSLGVKMAKMRFMEPSAGGGAFADAIREWLDSGLKPVDYLLICVEVDRELASGLVAKGHNVHCADFLTLQPKPANLCDYIFMNPPFTGGQDMRHVMHAFRFLKPGGKLVAITGSQAGRGQNKLHQEFAAFLEAYESESYELVAGTFAESGTQVATIVHTLYHPDF